jgi:hypothetical protein
LDGLPARTAAAKLGRYAGDCTYVSIRVNAKSQRGFDGAVDYLAFITIQEGIILEDPFSWDTGLPAAILDET